MPDARLCKRLGVVLDPHLAATDRAPRDAQSQQRQRHGGGLGGGDERRHRRAVQIVQRLLDRPGGLITTVCRSRLSCAAGVW
ncbi:MAG: transposase DNA-binding-containing protein [Armatimonadota bacterium]